MKYWRAATNDIQAVSHISNSFYFPVYKTSHFCSFLLIWIFHKERRHYIFKFEAILEASCEWLTVTQIYINIVVSK